MTISKNCYFINERGPTFWDTSMLAKETQYAQMAPSGASLIPLSPSEYEQKIHSLKGKKVLVYVHGLQTNHRKLMDSQELLVQNFSQLKVKMPLWNSIKGHLMYFLGYSEEEAYSGECPYDAIIGYSWPSFDHFGYYYEAKKHALTLAPKFAQEIQKISSIAQRTDIMAHSMGNLVVFEALASPSSDSIAIDNIYSLAAALPHDCFIKNTTYSKILKCCKYIFVFHSKHDLALNWPFSIVEKTAQALGLNGPATATEHQHQIKAINASNVVKGHSDYLLSKSLYEYLLKLHNNEVDLGLHSTHLV